MVGVDTGEVDLGEVAGGAGVEAEGVVGVVGGGLDGDNSSAVAVFVFSPSGKVLVRLRLDDVSCLTSLLLTLY